FSRDWSSDVCSSDLITVFLQLGCANAADFSQLFQGFRSAFQHVEQGGVVKNDVGRHPLLIGQLLPACSQRLPALVIGNLIPHVRSEERRVGKGGRAR